MGIRIPDLLAGILDATAAKTAATARIDGLRAALERIATDRLANDGAAPTWKAPGAGVVRYDPPGPWTATVADPDAFGSFVAEHYPSEATGVIRLPADQLEGALLALGFAGIPEAELEATVEVRDAWSKGYLAGLTVDVEETADDAGAVVDRAFTIVDDKGLLPEGLSGTRAAGKLVVTMDRDRRTSVVNAALDEAKATVAAAVGADAPAPVDRVEAREGRTVTIDELVGSGLVKPASELERPPAPELTAWERAEVARFDRAPDYIVDAREGLEQGIDAIEALDNREALRRIAKARNVSASGTKREVAERLYADGFRA